MTTGLLEATVFLGAAVVVVPLFKKAGLGSVLGYLAAGVAIGPFALGLVGGAEEILHFAELGVVFLLFLIGLELQPSRLWSMRRKVFGLGGLQVVITALVLAVAARFLGLPLKAAVFVGLALSLSSTAFVLQILAEKNQLTTAHGKAGFGILLCQDLVVIPIMAVMPILGTGNQTDGAPNWLVLLKSIAVIGLVILLGRYVTRPVFRWVAGLKNHELFTALSLLIVIGTALLMQAIGLSMALGAFLAGVLLAESEYRNALEADIEPFKGLLLGLFFIAVGMSADLGLLGEYPFLILGLAFGLMVVKACVLFGLGYGFGLPIANARSLALVLAQGGEFAFVLFGIATGFSVLEKETADLLILVVTVSMVLTPLILILNEKGFAPQKATGDGRPFDEINEPAGGVIIAGYGRFGQILSRVLTAKGIHFTALDASPEHVDFVRKFGNKIHYGDAVRLEILRAAGIEEARILVVAVDRPEVSLKIVQTVKQHFPHVKIFARAYDRIHAYKLLDLGVENLERETFLSSLRMAGNVLQTLGLTYSAAKQATDRFQQYDEESLRANYRFEGDIDALTSRAKLAAVELEALFHQDAEQV